jgi:hypothetical protein
MGKVKLLIVDGGWKSTEGSGVKEFLIDNEQSAIV